MPAVILRALPYAIAAALGFALAWFWQSNDYTGQLASQQSEFDRAARTAAEDAQRELIRATTAKDAALTKRELEVADLNQRLQSAENETKRIAAGVAAGSIRLRVDAKCPAASNVPGAAAVPSGTARTGAELSPAAGRAYNALRAGAERAVELLERCRIDLRARSAP